MAYRGLLPIPPKAFALWVVLAIGGGLLGFLVGDWILPLILALWHDGWAGLTHIPLESHVFAHIPEWVDPAHAPPHRLSGLYALLEICNMVIIFFFAVLSCKKGINLWYSLAVKKWKWVSEEDAKRFGRKQIM